MTSRKMLILRWAAQNQSREINRVKSIERPLERGRVAGDPIFFRERDGELRGSGLDLQSPANPQLP